MPAMITEFRNHLGNGRSCFAPVFATTLFVSRSVKCFVVKFEGSYHGWHDYLYWSVRFDPAKAGPASNPVPVAGSSGIWPAVKTKLPLLIACEYGPIACGAFCVCTISTRLFPSHQSPIILEGG